MKILSKICYTTMKILTINQKHATEKFSNSAYDKKLGNPPPFLLIPPPICYHTPSVAKLLYPLLLEGGGVRTVIGKTKPRGFRKLFVWGAC